jgi:hypothetical protein
MKWTASSTFPSMPDTPCSYLRCGTDGPSGADFEPLGHKTGQYLVCETPEEDNLL